MESGLVSLRMVGVSEKSRSLSFTRHIIIS